MLSALVMFYSTGNSIRRVGLLNLCDVTVLVEPTMVSYIRLIYCPLFLFNCLSFVTFLVTASEAPLERVAVYLSLIICFCTSVYIDI